MTPASTACTWRSITRRPSIWCRCPASISARWRARPRACGSVRWFISSRCTRRCALIEEICILDHLSHGRMEVGIGRGVSPFELKYHKIDHEESRAIFIDAFSCISAGLTTDALSHSGKYYQFEDVPIALRPLQKPHPAFWYGSSNTTGAAWVGEHGMHFLSLGPTSFAKANIDAFRDALAKRGGPDQPKHEFPGGTAIGVLRHIFVAETDAEAKRFGKPA